MFFNFEDRGFDTPTVESAISWREQMLVSLFAHVVLVILVVFTPRLPFVEEAAARRAERLAEIEEAARMAELQAQLMNRPDDDRRFVFVAPRFDPEIAEPPAPDAALSDQDRVAQSPLRTLDPQSRLPVADGDTLEFVEADESTEGLDPVDPLDDGTPEEVEADADVPLEEQPAENAPERTDDPRVADVTAGDAETAEVSDPLLDDPGRRPEDVDGLGRFADSSLTVPGTGPGDPDETQAVPDREADGLLGQVRETLRRSIRQQSFGNVSGDTGRFGPEIQFDTKGVEFGPWIRRFIAQIRRNWFIPYSVLANHGHVVLTFNVHRDGSLTDLTVLQPSVIESFNRSASNALRLSNPTQPLPVEYPDEQAFFTVTFYFNEIPPGR